ncbi:THAP domain-containing protein 5-like [Anopheles aquasalis]|uniref:THAP domain-containing protein 5-like n=1 Tax=Anopheles aquasalis TaxID=42839 RepID=UPI00215AD3FB|nr:THAP domain-containing protein 5-like [Anopheles aquasalis]
MPYRTCEASFCKNNSTNVKKLNRLVTFHSFPQDYEQNRQWKTFCRQDANWRLSQCSTICSDHFKAEDYQLHQSPLNRHSLRALKLTAIPSVACNQTSHASMKQREKKRTLATNDPYKSEDDLENEFIEPSLLNEKQLEKEYTHKRKALCNSPTRSECSVNIDHLYDPLGNAQQSQLNEIQEEIKALESENQKLVKVNLQLRLRLKEIEGENDDLKAERERIQKALNNKGRSNLDHEAY